MAQKRKIEGGAPEPPPSSVYQDELEEEPESFTEWLKGTYAKYWYGLICLFVDLLVPFTLIAYLDTPLLPEALILTILLLLAAEYAVYRKIWAREEDKL
jgi:hypothetical protein